MMHSEKAMQSIGWMLALLLVCLLTTVPVLAQEDSTDDWPREIDTPQGTVVI